MAYESWSVGVFIRATSNLSSVMVSGAASAARTNTMLKSQNDLIARRTALLKQVSATQQFARVATTAFVGLGVAAGAAIYAGVKGAADLQTAMISVAISTHTATNHMQGLYNLVMRTSGLTAQSATTIGGELATAASAGLTKRAQLAAAFPQIARAADVLWIAGKATGRSINPTQAVSSLSQLTHLFGAYQGPALKNMLDEAVSSFFVQPEAINRIVAQGKLFIPLGLSAGISTQDIWSQILMMGQSGFLRGRGGSGVRMAIQRMLGASSGTIAGTLTAHQAQAARELRLTDAHGHMIFEDKTGHLLFQKMIDHLYTMQRYLNHAQFTHTLINWAGPQGGSLLAAELRPAAYEQYRQNRKRMEQAGGVHTLWSKYVKSFNYQLGLDATNFKNLFIDVFQPLLPQLTSLLTDLGNSLQSDGNWLLKHPAQAKMIGKGIFLALGVSLGGIVTTTAIATANIWRLNAALGALAASSGADEAAGGTRLVGAGLMGSALPILAAAGAVAGILGIGYGTQQLMRNWAPLNSAITNSIIELKNLPGPLHAFGQSLEGIARTLGLIKPGNPLYHKNILDKHGHYVSFGGKHTMQAGPALITSHDIVKMMGTNLLHSPKGIIDGIREGFTAWMRTEWEGNPSIMTDAQVDKLEKAYEKQAREMHASAGTTIHVDQPVFNFPEGTPAEHAHEFIKNVMGDAQTTTRTTGIRHPYTPYFPMPSLFSQ